MARELDPENPVDRELLAAMRWRSQVVAEGVLADVYDRGSWLEVRAVLASTARVPGAVGRWLDTLPKDRMVIVPAVLSARLTGMLERRGFVRHTWWDVALGLFDEGAMMRDPEELEPVIRT